MTSFPPAAKAASSYQVRIGTAEAVPFPVLVIAPVYDLRQLRAGFNLDRVRDRHALACFVIYFRGAFLAAENPGCAE